MGTANALDPTGTQGGLYPVYLYGEYVRDVDDQLGQLELAEYEIERVGGNTVWHFLGPIPTGNLLEDTFYVSLPDLGLRNDDYQWRAKVRDRLGNWSEWSEWTAFDVLADDPVLSDPRPSGDGPVTLDVLAGFRMSAAIDNTGNELQVVACEVEVTTEADTGFDTPLWRYLGPPQITLGYSAKDQGPANRRLTKRYGGPALPYGATYLWRMRAVNFWGSVSEWAGGSFELTARDYLTPDPETTVSDAFTQVWETSAIPKPVGLMYDASDSGNVKVIDRQSLNLYTLQQSDRTIVGTQYIGDAVQYPAGLSNDPSDGTVMWLLRAPWVFGGSTSSGNRFACLARSDLSIVHNFDPGSGRWTAIKVSGSYLYAANWDDHKIYQFNKTTGAVVASGTITYDGVQQEHPTGIMVDGTDLYYFFYNDGTTKRFLKAAETDPWTITAAKSTEGLAIIGGEMDTTTHTEMFGDSDTLGRVWKFTLLTVTTENGGQAGRPEPAVTTAGDA